MIPDPTHCYSYLLLKLISWSVSVVILEQLLALRRSTVVLSPLSPTEPVVPSLEMLPPLLPTEEVFFSLEMLLLFLGLIPVGLLLSMLGVVASLLSSLTG